MRFVINGKTYKLREEVVIRIQGIVLLALGIICHKAEIDGAALFFWFYGAIMILPNVNNILYRIARKIVKHKEGRYAIQDGKIKASAGVKSQTEVH